MAKLRFTLTAGALYRRTIRKHLQNAKSDIEFSCEKAHVEIQENKTLVDSDFLFLVTDLTDLEALALKKSFEEYFAKLKDAIA